MKMLESEYFKGRYFKERRNVEARGIKLCHVVVLILSCREENLLVRN